MFIVDVVYLFYLSYLGENVTNFKNLHSKESLRCMIRFCEV